MNRDLEARALRIADALVADGLIAADRRVRAATVILGTDGAPAGTDPPDGASGGGIDLDDAEVDALAHQVDDLI